MRDYYFPGHNSKLENHLMLSVLWLTVQFYLLFTLSGFVSFLDSLMMSYAVATRDVFNTGVAGNEDKVGVI